MTPSISVKLSGNLGERHHSLNTFVCSAYHQNIPFESIQDQPEKYPTDRLLKIDLASKQRNVHYIIETLKDDDMLYVTRALKSLWLLDVEYSDIFNPDFLEHELFPQMTLQAVNKTRHWIQMHLKDPQRCSKFYEFYKDKNFEVASKFLWNCSDEYILNEINDILDKIKPKDLKLLSERVPQATKIYYDQLNHNQTVLKYYLTNDLKFFETIKYLLKTDAEVFFYVIENFFVHDKFPSLSTNLTKYILKHHKDRFMAKPELYTAWFLNIEALAKCLNPVEVKDLVIKLAKAEFLASWFSYKRVEPLLKALCVDERTILKKLVFVDKTFGPTLKEWPYPIPIPPVLAVPQGALFVDREIRPPRNIMDYMRCKGGGGPGCFKSKLDLLFDQYRFSSFKDTLFELRKRLRAESSPQYRQYMLLVLVSKTGGRVEDLAILLDLLSHYKNEPVQMRAAIVRSLVKRAFVWRLPSDQWAKFLNFGHGLGLNGSSPETVGSVDHTDFTGNSNIPGNRTPHIQALVQSSNEIACDEGLHAVIIRDLLAGVTPNEAVWKSFLDKFSPLAEYSLSFDERNQIGTRLPMWLLTEAQSHPEIAGNRLHLLLDTLSAYKIYYDTFPGTIDVIAVAAKSDFESAKSLLSRLYKAGVARDKLIKEYFDLIQTDDSYVNALRHETALLETTERFENLIYKKNSESKEKIKYDKFLRKLALYFTEKDGLGERYRVALELRASTTPDKTLARPLAILAGSTFPSLLNGFDAAPSKTPQRQLAAALRSNAHLVRPALHLESLGWREIGAKAVANRVAMCRQKDLEKYLPQTLSWNRTLRLALVLGKRTNKELESYEFFASKRPGAALKAALKYFSREGDKSDPRIWHTVKHHIAKYDELRCHYSITIMDNVPAVIKPDYCVMVYRKYKGSSKEAALSVLYHIPAILHLHEVDDQFILEEIEEFLRDASTGQMFFRENRDAYEYNRGRSYLFVDMIAKYLLLSTTEDEFEERFRRIGLPFFKVIEVMWKRFSAVKYLNREYSPISEVEYHFLHEFMDSVNYNKAFFNTQYASCLNLFEKLTEWMHSFLSTEKWFEIYAKVHVTMLYLKTVRYCLKKSPELFTDESRKLHEGVDMLGTVFGKYIANEIEELGEKYYPSVCIFYAENLRDYLMRTYYYKYDKSIENFLKALLLGMLSEKESVPAYILAAGVFERFGSKLKDDREINNILTSFKKSENKELSFRVLQDDINGKARNF